MKRRDFLACTGAAVVSAMLGQTKKLSESVWQCDSYRIAKEVRYFHGQKQERYFCNGEEMQAAVPDELEFEVACWEQVIDTDTRHVVVYVVQYEEDEGGTQLHEFVEGFLSEGDSISQTSWELT